MTMAEALEIQRAHLAKWKQVLKPEIYPKLEAWALAPNADLTNPYDVRRGDDLHVFVVNQLST